MYSQALIREDYLRLYSKKLVLIINFCFLDSSRLFKIKIPYKRTRKKLLDYATSSPNNRKIKNRLAFPDSFEFAPPKLKSHICE